MALITGIVYPNEGDRIKASDHNLPIQKIVAEVNGNLDSSNIASVSGTKLTAGSVPMTAFDSTVAAGWTQSSATLSAITANGNRSYTATTSADLRPNISNGMRLRFTNTVAGPTQSTSLNGTNQYWNRSTTINGMTFTNNFAVGAWIKLTNYPASGASAVMSRFNGTSGWIMMINTSGQVILGGYNGGAANSFGINSYQSVPLNKWVHVTAQMDMTVTTNTSTTNYVMIDGVDVPTQIARGGTNPTALVQAGNLEVGSYNLGTNLFPGKIASAWVSSVKITQANVRTLMGQTLTSALITANSIISAYSFNGVATDLNTTNANDLTPQASAGYTADSYTGLQADGTVSSTLNYGIISNVTSTTVTMQVPEGNTIPTTGGIASFSYSPYKAPYGMPTQKDKWRLSTLNRVDFQVVSVSAYATVPGHKISVPYGAWDITTISTLACTNQASFGIYAYSTLSQSTTAEDDRRMTKRCFATTATAAAGLNYTPGTLSKDYSGPAMDFYELAQTNSTGAASYILGNEANNEIRADNAYL